MIIYFYFLVKIWQTPYDKFQMVPFVKIWKYSTNFLDQHIKEIKIVTNIFIAALLVSMSKFFAFLEVDLRKLSQAYSKNLTPKIVMVLLILLAYSFLFASFLVSVVILEILVLMLKR